MYNYDMQLHDWNNWFNYKAPEGQKDEKEVEPPKEEEKKPPVAKPVSKVAAPITPVGGGATASSRSLDDPEVGYQEYRRRRDEGENPGG